MIQALRVRSTRLPFPKDVSMSPSRANDKLCAQEFHRFFFFKNCPINISLSIKKDLSDKSLKRFVRKNFAMDRSLEPVSGVRKTFENAIVI